jgi:hypothetical protein
MSSNITSRLTMARRVAVSVHKISFFWRENFSQYSSGFSTSFTPAQIQHFMDPLNRMLANPITLSTYFSAAPCLFRRYAKIQMGS